MFVIRVKRKIEESESQEMTKHTFKMRCACQQSQSRPSSPTTITAPTNESNTSKPYQQIVFNASGPNTRFEWVSSSQSSQTSVRTRVRSHVMQRFRAQQALNGQYQQEQNQNYDVQPSQVGCRPPFVTRRSGVFPDYDPRIEHYYTCPNCGHLKPELCKKTTSERDFERHIRVFFSPLPVDPTKESAQLFEYLRGVYAFIQNPVRRNGLGIVQYCFPFIVSSAAMLNALLSLVATHRMLIGGYQSEFVTAYYHHKVQAIQIINQSIAMHLNTVASDILAAIAVLAIIEYTTGSIENAQNHMNGLRQIMASNTGAAPANQYLALRIMNLATLLTSQTSSSPLTEQASLDHLLSKELPRDTHTSIRNMFCSLKQLSVTMPRTPVTIAQESEWLDRLNVTEFETHRILENDLSLQTIGSCSFSEWRAYPIAGCIFMGLWLRQLALRSNVFDYLVNSLVCSLEGETHSEESEEEGLEEKEDHYPPTISLWLLFVGGAATEGRQNRPWFLTRIPPILRKLELGSWQVTREILMKFPYVEECEMPFRRIWDEIGVKL